MFRLFVTAFLVLVGFQLSCHAQSVQHDGKCPRRLIGACFCPDKVRSNTGHRMNNNSTPGFTTASAIQPNPKDTCNSDDDCDIDKKCCKSGCCGYKKCVESQQGNEVKPIRHPGICPRRLIGACFCPDRVHNSTTNRPNVSTTTQVVIQPNTKDTCRSDNDCSATEKCCQSGCCGYRKCVVSEQVNVDRFCNSRINEEYKECGSLCAESCENRARPLPCPLVCKGGCFCKNGFRRRSDGQCVRQEDCVPKEES